jgi:hypothetical protein
MESGMTNGKTMLPSQQRTTRTALGHLKSRVLGLHKQSYPQDKDVEEH